jgi:hypothetical protein
MKFTSGFLALMLTASAASAFVTKPTFSRATILSVTKDEDLELTRKVISDFMDSETGGVVPDEKPPKKEKETVAAAEE